MEPLPAAHIAGLTPKDVAIRFFDDRMEEIDFDAPTDLVAMSVETYTARRAYQIASEYRRRNVPIVMGGFHATLCPDEVAEYADAVVVGEAEELWPKLIEDFAAKRLKPLYKGTARPDLSKALPDRSIFGSRKYLPVTLVEASRGCTFKCDFCVIQRFFNSTQTSRGTEALVEDVSRLKKSNRLIFFVDDNAVSNPERAKELFEALIPLKVRWVSQATITMARDKELLKILKASGCQGVLIGFESLEPRNLRQMNKRFNAVRGGALEAVRAIHREGLRLYGTFLFGYDYDSVESFQRTLDFCIDEKLFMVAFNHLTPFPGTPLYARLAEEKRLLFDRWWLDEHYRYGMVPFRTEMSPELIRQCCVTARKKFYSVSSILGRFRNRANWSNAGMIFPYFFVNFLLRGDVALRNGLPLGDTAWRGELLKVQRLDPAERVA